MDRLLVIEDSFEVRTGLEMALAEEGYEVEAVGTGEEGLRSFEAAEPDLVLLDLGLPGISGVEVCQRIRKSSYVPIIIFSAAMETSEKIQALRVGADDYVVKGTEINELLARIEAQLRWRRMRRDGADAETS